MFHHPAHSRLVHQIYCDYRVTFRATVHRGREPVIEAAAGRRDARRARQHRDGNERSDARHRVVDRGTEPGMVIVDGGEHARREGRNGERHAGSGKVR